ncbi:DMT family transporter [Indioceanicola profundi]|uniref:DMT family transporter n=1 Tax=Indioceanicola profundi TaxID=2220096 RepID=UPI000E6AB281|nr:EamA family transporter [Indioceanicola profundi]
MSSNTVLYAAAVLIWGSTWFGIKFQLGIVDPAVSIAYRFTLAGVLLLVWLAVRRQPLIPARAAWSNIALTGLFSFCLSYLCSYAATGLLTSGLVAVAGSALSVMNVLNSRIFLGQPVKPRVLLGGSIGVFGVLLLFLPSISLEGLGGASALGLAIIMLGNYFASAGNMAVAKARKAEVPLLPATAWGMLAGAGLTALTATMRGAEFTFDPSPAYVLSLLYLTLFGSLAAFLSYFTLLGRIGADRAGYVAVMVPIVALIISTLFEGYQWTMLSVLGLGLAVGGNLLVMTPPGWRLPGRLAAAVKPGQP